MNHVVHAHIKSIMPENLTPADPVFLGGGSRPNARFQELCALAGIEPRTNIETGAQEASARYAKLHPTCRSDWVGYGARRSLLRMVDKFTWQREKIRKKADIRGVSSGWRKVTPTASLSSNSPPPSSRMPQCRDAAKLQPEKYSCRMLTNAWPNA